jgi:hypothetical protein
MTYTTIFHYFKKFLIKTLLDILEIVLPLFFFLKMGTIWFFASPSLTLGAINEEIGGFIKKKFECIMNGMKVLVF